MTEPKPRWTTDYAIDQASVLTEYRRLYRERVRLEVAGQDTAATDHLLSEARREMQPETAMLASRYERYYRKTRRAA
jgi:hypothetical protein